MKSNSDLIVRVPVDFFLSEDNPHRDLIYRFADRLLMITSFIEELRNGEYLRLSRNGMRKLFGGNAAMIFRLAEAYELIDRDHSYSVGVMAKGVRLSSSHRTGKWREVVLLRRLKDRTDYLDEVSLWLRNQFDKFEITSPDLLDPWSAYAVDAIKQRRWRIVRDDFGNRVHSNFTSLCKSNRRQLQLKNVSHISIQQDDLDLFEVDIKNCQPMLLGYLARSWFLRTARCVPSDVSDWIEICERGRFYEVLAEKAGKFLDDGLPNRNWVKSNVMVAHYAKQYVVNHCELAQVEAAHFPNVYRYLCWLRAQPIEGDIRSRWYRRTALEAQRLESQILIDGVCGYLMRQWPDTIVLPVHDSLTTPSVHLPRVNNALKSVFGELKLSPLLHPTRLAELRV